MRLKLLQKVPLVVKLFGTVQELEKIEYGETVVRYYGFIAIIDGWKLKVIVKKVGNGNYMFWSVIPNWITKRKRDGKLKYKNSIGNMEID